MGSSFWGVIVPFVILCLGFMVSSMHNAVVALEVLHVCIVGQFFMPTTSFFEPSPIFFVPVTFTILTLDVCCALVLLSKASTNVGPGCGESLW